MIISFLIKHIRTILDALIIAAVVVAFSFFDPFGWFRGKVKIQETPVTVESIRQIGQLTTAEYYGEAIASLAQNQIDFLDADQVNKEGQALFAQLFFNLDSLKQRNENDQSSSYKIKEKNIETRMWENFPWTVRNKFYPLLLRYLQDTLKSRSGKEYKSKEILWELYKHDYLKAGYLTINKSFIPKGFYNFIRQHEEEQLRDSKKNIVYIGRGWVKAGIDFGNLQAKNISYNPNNKTIYLSNCETRILDCDINPWFIPGKVKGYELIKEKGNFKNPFAEAVKVKKQCVENLRVQAIKSGIMEQAQQNATESLKNLFNLLSNNEIEQVVFTSNKFKLILEEIGNDHVISDAEAVLINELIQNSLLRTDSLSYNDYRRQLPDLLDFCQRLTNYSYAGTSVNAYALDLSPFIANDTIRSFYADTVTAILSGKNRCDSIRIKHKIIQLMAQYNLPQKSFMDSCFNMGLLETGKSKAEYHLSGMAKIYRDSIFKQAQQTCLHILQNPGNRYAIWFKNEAECDSSRLEITRHLKKLNPELFSQ